MDDSLDYTLDIQWITPALHLTQTTIIGFEWTWITVDNMESQSQEAAPISAESNLGFAPSLPLLLSRDGYDWP